MYCTVAADLDSILGEQRQYRLATDRPVRSSVETETNATVLYLVGTKQPISRQVY